MEALPRWFGNSPVAVGLYSKVVYPTNNSEGKEGGRGEKEGGREGGRGEKEGGREGEDIH